MGDDDALVEERPLTPNRNGANLFLGPQLIRQWACPLNPGENCITRIIPHVGVLLLPETPDYPIDLTVHETHSRTTNPDRSDPDPDSNTDMDTTHEPR